MLFHRIIYSIGLTMRLGDGLGFALIKIRLGARTARAWMRTSRAMKMALGDSGYLEEGSILPGVQSRGL